MNSFTLLIVEGKKNGHPTFASALEKKGFNVIPAANGAEALEQFVQTAPDAVILNAASLGSSGARTIQVLREKQGEDPLPILLILPEKADAPKTSADAVLTLPFTAQKLLNRLRALLPSDEAKIFHAGQIRLDTEHRRVKCLGKNARLTRRLSALLKILMERKGEVVSRGELFKTVWETEYTGDTRTLDVHISWLRRAIELDPAHPKLLNTVRGIGYRLDV